MKGIIGPQPCSVCGGTYGEHSDDCSENPKNKPFEPTMNLRFKNDILEQEFARPDGVRQWQPIPKSYDNK